jgi:predicted GIY-YIG superfamily endonuclease
MGEKPMIKKRDTYTYHQKQGNRIVHSGITNNLERRESEHRQRWSGSRIFQVGRLKTKESALSWEKNQQKAITPKRS